MHAQKSPTEIDGGGSGRSSFHVTPQNSQQVMQLFLSFHLRPGALNAVAQVRMNQSLREGFQSLACGYQLHQYFRALTVLLQHPLYRVQLPNNPANPKFFNAKYQLTFTGGTGAFASASGVGEITEVVMFTSQTTGTFTWTLNGLVTTPK